jgi:cytochrome b subunit of formate dehydrogenase
MVNARINYIVDILIAISFLVTAITGLIVFFFSSGVRQGGFQTFFGIIKGMWLVIHNWSGVIFIILVILHFVLHWNWVMSMTKNIFSKKTNELKGGKK